MNLLTKALQGFLQVLFAGVLSELRQLREEVIKMAGKQAGMAETQKTNQDVLIEQIGLLKDKQDAMFKRVTAHQDADALALAELNKKLSDLQNSHGNSPQLEAAIGVVNGMIKADDEFDPAAPVETPVDPPPATEPPAPPAGDPVPAAG